MILKIIGNIIGKLKASIFDLLPIIIVVSFFQIVVLQQPFPNLNEIIIGLFFVVIGLMLFVEGLEIGLFPIGENLSYTLAKKGSLFWLLSFSFLLGFSTTIAEPALIAVSKEAAEIALESDLINSENESGYAFGLRLTVAISVGIAILIGIWRIIKGWPVYYIIVGGYVIVIVMTLFAPEEIIGIAYDAGGVTTSTITVPLVTALGVGLATVIEGRSPLTDGFGLIAIASLLPMIFVMGYGMFIF
jgi:hypothetical protein